MPDADPGPGGIHRSHPFAPPEGQRDPTRRFRGRLTAPVTVWTAGTVADEAGLTVSSLMVAEGDPTVLVGLVGDLTEFWEQAQEHRSFTVHVLGDGQEALAERFAGRTPILGGLYAGLDAADSDHGPILGGVQTRARCRLIDSRALGYGVLVEAAVEAFDVAGLDDPLVFFRGRYRRLAPRRRTAPSPASGSGA